MGKKAFWRLGHTGRRFAKGDWLWRIRLELGIMGPRNHPVLELGSDNLGLDFRNISLGATSKTDLGARENRAK